MVGWGCVMTPAVLDQQPQHMVALQRANELRCARSVAKRRINAGELSVADALSLECVQSMTVCALLCAQHRVMVTRARRVLSQVPLSEARRVRDLTERQRAALLEVLGS